MPQATDLTINNGAATPVAKTFTLYSQAAGDNSLATWKLKDGPTAIVFPVITALTRPTGNQARKLQLKFKLPSYFTDSGSGLTTVGSAFELDVSATMPDNFPEVMKNDAVAFASNLIAHSLIKAMMRDAIPAT